MYTAIIPVVLRDAGTKKGNRMKGIAVVATTSSSSLSTGDIIGIVALVIVAAVFLLLWKQAKMKWAAALIYALLPFIIGILVGSYGTVAHELYHLSGGKIGF